MRSPAVVLGLDLNGLGVVRALGRAGIPVIGMDHRLSHPGRASRYCRKLIEADPCSPDALLAALGTLSREVAGPGVLFPTMDDTVRILSEHRNELPENLRVGFPEASMLRRLMDKEGLVDLARAHHWPVPATAVCRNEEEVAAVASWFPFPGVMKPGRRDLDAPRGIPQKLWTFGTPGEMRAAYRALSRWEPNVVLQEKVPGPDSAVVFCLFYADAAATPKALFVGRKMRQYPPLYGSTSSAEPIEDEQVRRFAVSYIRDVSYHGLGSVEMKIHATTGERVFIEPTVGRTDYQSYVAVANGVNIPETAYRDLMGLPSVPSTMVREPVKYFVFLSDWRSAREHIRRDRETWRGYLRSLRGRRVLSLLQVRDPGPWLYRVHYFTSGRALRALERVARLVWSVLRGRGATKRL